MGCISIAIDLPTLPAPWSIEPPALPDIEANAAICCFEVEISIPIPIPIPALLINPTVILLLNAAFDVVEAYIDALPLDCPLD